MDYISDMQIKEIGTDVFVISTPVGKYLLDNVSASIAQLNNRIELENQVHMDALYKTLDVRRERKRIFSPQEYIHNKKLCRLMIYLNSGCNMRCIYCHCDSTVGDNMPDELISMTLEKYYTHICNRLDAVNEFEEVPQITFMGGGEPFLRFEKIKGIVTKFNEMCAGIHLVPRYVLVTNTTLGTDENWKWLVDHNFMLNLSLDGPEYIQNRNRPLYGNKPSFEQIRKRLQFLSDINASCHVRSTIINIDEVSKVCEFFKQFSCVKTHALEPVSIAGRAKKTGLNVDTNHFYSDFFHTYAAFLLNEPDRFKSSWFSPFKRTEGFCGAVYCNAIVLPDGNITLCSEVDSKETRDDIKTKFIVGNVAESGDVFETDKAIKFSEENRLNQLPNCAHCPIKYKCGGGCYIKKIRDFDGNSNQFYDTFCRSAIKLNISFLIGCLENVNKSTTTC